MASPAPELRTAVESWFKRHGLSIHETHYQFDHSFFAWRHYGHKESLTLWISQLTSEDYEPRLIMHMLENIEPQALMNEYRHVHVHVASNDSEFGVHVRDTFTPTAA